MAMRERSAWLFQLWSSMRTIRDRLHNVCQPSRICCGSAPAIVHTCVGIHASAGGRQPLARQLSDALSLPQQRKAANILRLDTLQSHDSLLQKGDAALQSGYGPCRAHRPQPGCFVESTYLRYIP